MTQIWKEWHECFLSIKANEGQNKCSLGLKVVLLLYRNRIFLLGNDVLRTVNVISLLGVFSCVGKHACPVSWTELLPLWSPSCFPFLAQDTRFWPKNQPRKPLLQLSKTGLGCWEDEGRRCPLCLSPGWHVSSQARPLTKVPSCAIRSHLVTGSTEHSQQSAAFLF